MDKLAPTIAWIKENGFWLANGLLLLLMIGIWFMVTGSLHEAREKNESKINQQFNTVQAIRRQKPADLADDSAPLHPNRITKEGMQEELEASVDSLIAAWHLRVDAQKKLLVFPEVLGDQFTKVFAPYNPPETFPVKYVDFKIDGLLSFYRLKIKDHMINICGKDGVRTNWKWDPANYEQSEDEPARKKRGNAGYDGFDGGDGQTIEVEDEDASRFAVLWSDVNQELWHDKLTVFQDRDDHFKESNDPTPLQAYMLQQDLWVLEAMFNVIRELNGDSTATDTSSIKRIDHIAIGVEGNVKLGVLHDVDRRFGPEVVDEETSSDGMEGRSFGGGGGGQGSEYGVPFLEEDELSDPDDEGYGAGRFGEFEDDVAKGLPPFHERYVDTKFEPISSEEVLKVVQGEELSETNLELLIAKRLPVRIGLRMDERKIADFMAASINSPFSFEIQQVRINRHTEAEEIELGGGKGTTSGYGRNDNGDQNSDFDEVSEVETRVNYDVNVEFFGIIKIYNPVRPDLIRKAAGLKPEDDPADSAAIQNGSSRIRNAG